jgi:hypothetical protein
MAIIVTCAVAALGLLTIAGMLAYAWHELAQPAPLAIGAAPRTLGLHHTGARTPVRWDYWPPDRDMPIETAGWLAQLHLAGIDTHA